MILAQGLYGATDTGGNDRKSKRHRFQYNDGKPFEERRQHEQVSGGKQIRHIRALAETEFADVIVKSLFTELDADLRRADVR